ncbi:MAG: magnesium transporter CorA family protein [Planctomycetota bacterium]|nr:magnesium transporter CorA family protein [Planctomycetota bacterium]
MAIGFALLPGNECRPLKSLEDLAELWTQSDVRVWVDLESPSEEDLQRLNQIIALDDEALEDCLHGEQQPRVDEFESYIFLVLYGLHGLKEQEDLDPHKLAAFCGTRFLITVGRHPLLSVRQVRARCGRHPETLLVRGVDVVLFEIIDTIVDYYLSVIDRYEDRLEALEERSFDMDVDEEVLEQVAEVRRDLLELRRLAVAQRHLLQPVAKGEYDFVSETLGQQFSHVCDHLSQVIDSVDSLRETIVSIRDNYHAGLTRRTNEIMKVLTLYAGILLPLTLIAGIYGMNLPLWPPQNHPASFWGVLSGMLIIAGFLLVYFRRRRWL